MIFRCLSGAFQAHHPQTRYTHIHTRKEKLLIYNRHGLATVPNDLVLRQPFLMSLLWLVYTEKANILKHQTQHFCLDVFFFCLGFSFGNVIFGFVFFLGLILCSYIT
jgi:hypothetical protein